MLLRVIRSTEAETRRPAVKPTVANPITVPTIIYPRNNPSPAHHTVTSIAASKTVQITTEIPFTAHAMPRILAAAHNPTNRIAPTQPIVTQMKKSSN